jgi:hypothetical protein
MKKSKINRLSFLITICLIFAVKNLSAQSFVEDLKRGIYQLTPDWIVVHQLDSGMIYTTKLRQEHYHFNLLINVLFDTLPFDKIEAPYKKQSWAGEHYQLLKINEEQSALILESDTLFSAINFKRKEIGYEVFVTEYSKKMPPLLNQIKKDTLDYFTYSFFNLEDVRLLIEMKKFSSVTETEFRAMLKLAESRSQFYGKQIENTGKYSTYGSAETTEILVKVLFDLGYNPLIFPGEFTNMYKKFDK